MTRDKYIGALRQKYHYAEIHYIKEVDDGLLRLCNIVLNLWPDIKIPLQGRGAYAEIPAKIPKSVHSELDKVENSEGFKFWFWSDEGEKFLEENREVLDYELREWLKQIMNLPMAEEEEKE